VAEAAGLADAVHESRWRQYIGHDGRVERSACRAVRRPDRDSRGRVLHDLRTEPDRGAAEIAIAERAHRGTPTPS
jgi:hypothetical protein